MTNLIDRDWRLLPDLALADIMLMVGLESLESLHRCRQVCRTWNEKIMNNIWGNRKNKKRIKTKIEKSWGPGMFPSLHSIDRTSMTYPSNEEISHSKWLGKSFKPVLELMVRTDLLLSEAKDILPTGMVESLVQHFERCLLSPDEKPGEACLVSLSLEQQFEVPCVASLAHHRLLRSVKYLILSKVNLSSVPEVQLASLASCVTGIFDIWSVSGSGLVTILDSLKCRRLVISTQSLNTEETEALVRAMETVVEEVSLSYYHGDMTLDIEALTKYSGQGKCRLVTCYETRYYDALRNWKIMQEKCERRKWTFTQLTGIELRVAD